MAVDKIDPKVIFASEAPAQDTPAVFTNKTVGWGETRKNGGRPTIKQSNALQQETDLKILWLNENSITPFDPTIDYPVDAVTRKDGVFKILKAGVWELFLDKSSVGLGNVDNTSDLNKPVSTANQTALDLKADKNYVDTSLPHNNLIDRNSDGAHEAVAILNNSNQNQQEINDFGGAKWYAKVGGYKLGAAVKLENGDTVKSTEPANIVNPNLDMSGWVKAKDSTQLEYSLLKNKITQTIYEKLYESWSVKDFGAIGDGTLHTLQEWIDEGKFSNLTAIQFAFPFVTSLTDSVDLVAIQAAIYALPLNKDSNGILTPKGFANGGCIHVPRGRYVIDKKITMQRGLRLVGESRESSQLISFIGNDSVLQYADVGRYIQDEIVIQNLSIWQDPSVAATAGAAIDVIEGAASVQSLYLNVDNVYIEGTFYGIRHMAGVGGGVCNSNISKCVSHGVYLTGSVSTTSMAFANTYCHQNGGYGYVVERGAYITWNACASDSNALGGYHINQTKCYVISGSGAEANTGPAVKLTSAGGGVIDVFAIANTGGVIDAGATPSGTVYAPSGDWEGDGFAVRGGGGTPVHLGHGLVLRSEYAANRVAYQASVLDESQQARGKLVGGLANRWAIGSTQQPEPDTTFTVGGLADTGTTVGFKSIVQHGIAGSIRNVGTYSQFITQNTAITYKIGIGHFIPNSSRGGSSVIERCSGEYIVEQTQGSIANANLMIDGGQGTVPAGNWSIYNGSARPSYYGGALTWKPATSATPLANGDLTFEATSNTSITVKLKGSDGVVRYAVLTLT